MSRRLKSWINGFCDYNRHMGSSPLFVKWAAVAAVSGALERRCWNDNARGRLFPNVFVVLVSAPGIGKSTIIRDVRKFWARVPDLVIAPTSTTRSALIGFMADHKRIDVTQHLPQVINSIACASEELTELVPEYDNAWMGMLQQLYDCISPLQDITIAHKTRTLENSHMVLLAGTQPKYLDALLPEQAYGMGLFSRLVLIYEGSWKYTDLWTRMEKSNQLENYLAEDLANIAKLSGAFYLSPEAIDYWREHGPKQFAPVPDHPKLQHYNIRREAHLLKLCMVFSAAERSDLKITLDIVERARELLHETEKLMPQIFKEMSSKGYADANTEVWQFARQTWMTNGRKPIQESQMIKFMTTRFPNNQIIPTLNLMVQAGQLRVTTTAMVGGATFRSYTPTDQGG